MPAENANAEIIVRRLAPADASAFRELRLVALQESPTAFGSSYEEERDRPLSEFASRLEPSDERGVWGAFIGETLVGTVGLLRERQNKVRHKAFVWGMYVAPVSRRTGCGRRLMSVALNMAREMPGVRQVNLSVNAENLAAATLYQSLGFVPYGHERDALCIDGDYYDELHLTLFFQPSVSESNSG